MIKKFPIIRPNFVLSDAFSLLRKTKSEQIPDALSFTLKKIIPLEYLWLCNSGISAFYLVLEALKRISPREEVIIPAYTAGSLVVAIKKAGLKPVLCDISLLDFNMDEGCLHKVISENTLAVVLVHMFGIPMQGIETLRQKIPPQVFLIEDFCQAFGSRIKDKPLGVFGDVSFSSFNRGKNLCLLSGGVIFSNNLQLAEKLNQLFEQLKFEKSYDIENCLKILLYQTATNPYFYALFCNLMKEFKQTTAPKDFEVARFAQQKMKLAQAVIKRFDALCLERYRIGYFLLKGLSGISGIKLPSISEDYFVVFNRLPTLFEDMDKLRQAKSKLWQVGFETSQMYEYTLDEMFHLNIGQEVLPNAYYLARHLLTLPIYPGLRKKDLEAIIATVKKICCH
ncbi:MAG: DegT/DnrJ/EryC1/StrS family aminotransferase [Candidatus Omnitrophica bacterium]|nr:DegT/DnrJ/EryC1/StrS family aminotransferase [Candidatus Omnitrophota bacterium]